MCTISPAELSPFFRDDFLVIVRLITGLVSFFSPMNKHIWSISKLIPCCQCTSIILLYKHLERCPIWQLQSQQKCKMFCYLSLWLNDLLYFKLSFLQLNSREHGNTWNTLSIIGISSPQIYGGRPKVIDLVFPKWALENNISNIINGIIVQTWNTYIFKPVLTELCEKMEESQ